MIRFAGSTVLMLACLVLAVPACLALRAATRLARMSRDLYQEDD